jgi:DNA-binding transcriptional LysR family regulator
MNKFQEITTFTSVVDSGSFVKAAEQLGWQDSTRTVSRPRDSVERYKL